MADTKQAERSALEEAAYNYMNRSVGEGTIVRIVGPVVDVQFGERVPAIYTALSVEADTPMGHISTMLEVESQLPGGVVRTVAMSSTDGLQRGIKAIDTGHPLMMPVGQATLGRVWNVMGQPVDGGEVPIIDGSARPWMLQLSRVGVRQQQAERSTFTIGEPLHFEFAKTGSVFDVEPCDHFAVRCEIDFKDTVIGHQTADMNDFSESAASIAPCRTFVFLQEVEPLLHLNLIKGGSLDNALVFVNRDLTSRQLKRLAKIFNKDESLFKVHDGVLNTTDIYFPNEPARHKLLDFVGDIRLVGMPLNAKFNMYKPGHKANNAFARYLMEYIRKNN